MNICNIRHKTSVFNTYTKKKEKIKQSNGCLLLQLLVAVCLLAPPVTAPFPPCSPLTFINRVVQSSNLSYLYIYIFYIYLYLGGAVLQPLLRPPPLLPRAPLHLQGRHPGGTAQGGPGRCVHQGSTIEDVMECLFIRASMFAKIS